MKRFSSGFLISVSLPKTDLESPCITCVQYIGGNHECIGGYHECIEGCSVHRADIMSVSGVFSTSGRYHEYIGGCSLHREDTMSASGGYHE